MSPCVHVNGLHKDPNFLLLIPHRDARTAARIRIYTAKLVCCVFKPVRSIEGPAIAPAISARHLAVLARPPKAAIASSTEGMCQQMCQEISHIEVFPSKLQTLHHDLS